MSVLKEELIECLKELETRAKGGADGLENCDQVTLRKLASSHGVFEDDWEQIDFLERLCLLFHLTDNETDAANTFKLLSRTLRKMAKLSKLSGSVAFLDKLLRLEERLSQVIAETQSDPAAILGICLHVLLANSHTDRAKNLPKRRAKLLQVIDDVLELRFRKHSSDERIQKYELKLRKLRADTNSIPLTVKELVDYYLSEADPK